MQGNFCFLIQTKVWDTYSLVVLNSFQTLHFIKLHPFMLTDISESECPAHKETCCEKCAAYLTTTTPMPSTTGTDCNIYAIQLKIILYLPLHCNLASCTHFWRWSCLPPACDRCMITNALSQNWCETLFPFRANSQCKII